MTSERKDAVRDAEQFWRFLRLAVLVTGAAASIAAISKYSSAYYTEDAKQKAFMMKACVDAGGQWVKSLGPTWSCVLPIPDERR